MKDVELIGRALIRCYGIYILIVIGLLLFVAPFVNYTCALYFKNDFLFYFAGALILAFAVSFAAALFSAQHPVSNWRKTWSFTHVTLILTGILLALQASIFMGCMFYTGWDVAAMTRYEPNDFDPIYYSRYPNQLFLKGVFLGISTVAHSLGFENHYLVLAVIGGVGIALATLMIGHIGRSLGGNGVGYAAFGITAILGSLSPWILVPYSDSYGMFWVTLSLYAFVCIRKRGASWFIAAFAALIGYAIKPTAIFILAAMLFAKMLQLIMMARSRVLREALQNGLVKRWCGRLASVVAACAVAALCITLIKPPYVLNDEGGMPPTHYLLMGMNAETGGIYSEEDVIFSASFATYEERSEADIASAVDRIAKMGPFGLMKHLAKKTMTVYGDGSFAWRNEGSFFLNGITGHNEMLKQFYGIGADERGIFQQPWQVVWFVVLMGIAIFCLTGRKYQEGEVVIVAALILLSVFLLLFECRARYIFLYLPCFVVLGVLGWQRIVWRLRKMILSRRRDDA